MPKPGPVEDRAAHVEHIHGLYKQINAAERKLAEMGKDKESLEEQLRAKMKILLRGADSGHEFPSGCCECKIKGSCGRNYGDVFCRRYACM